MQRVLVVIGAGHLAGIERELIAQQDDPATLAAYAENTAAAARWPKWIGLGVLAIIIGAIVYAFTRGADFGALALRDWILVHRLLARRSAPCSVVVIFSAC